MTRTPGYLACTAVAVLGCAAGVAHAQVDGPTHDPFVRPAASMRRPERGGETVQPGAEEPWKPTLRAVMLAGAASMVDVDGTVVRIGEEIGGYRLVEVHEEEAVFEKSGKRYVLKIASHVDNGAAARGQP